MVTTNEYKQEFDKIHERLEHEDDQHKAIYDKQVELLERIVVTEIQTTTNTGLIAEINKKLDGFESIKQQMVTVCKLLQGIYGALMGGMALTIAAAAIWTIFYN